MKHRSAQPGADRLKGRAASVGTRLSDASARAGKTAGRLAHDAKDGAAQAKAWAAPRLEKAWQEGKRAAAPKVEHAAERALPLVDKTHDRLVDDVLPKLVAAVNAAAAATAVGADRAREATSARLAEIAHVSPPKRSRTGAKVFWSIAGLAVAGAVIAVFRRSRPTTDPWAEEPWEDDGLRSRAAEAKEELGEVAEAVGQAAGGAVAKTREVSEKVAGRTREATAKAEQAAPDRPAPKSSAASGSRASSSRSTGSTSSKSSGGTGGKAAPRKNPSGGAATDKPSS